MSIESGPKADPLEQYKKLIRSPKEHDAHPFHDSEKKTFAIEAEHGGRKLTFVGTRHAHRADSPVFEEIQERFDVAQPDIVYIEGAYGINENKEKMREEFLDLPLEQIKEYGESIFTLYLALKAGTDFESPEPNPREEFPHLEKAGFSKEDILAYYVFRTANSYMRHNEAPTETGLRDYILKEMVRWRTRSGWSESEFTDTLESVLQGVNMTTDYHAKMDPMPHEGIPREKSHDVAQSLSRFRQERILERIAAGLKTHKRLFVVYGSGHAVLLEPALRALVSES